LPASQQAARATRLAKARELAPVPDRAARPV